MFSHIMLGTNNLDASQNFYNALLGTLGAKPGVLDRHRIFWRHGGGTFSVSTPINGEPATVGNGSTFGFAAESIEQANGRCCINHPEADLPQTSDGFTQQRPSGVCPER